MEVMQLLWMWNWKVVFSINLFTLSQLSNVDYGLKLAHLVIFPLMKNDYFRRWFSASNSNANVRNWLVEEVSNSHWIYVNNDTIADIVVASFT